MTQTKFPTLLQLSLAPRIPPSSRQLPEDVLMPHGRLRRALFLQTQLMYKWAQPKICSEDLEGAVKLPASGLKTDCPPCNPGFFKTNSSTCEPCPYGSYSNGSGNPSPIPLPASLHSHTTHMGGPHGHSACQLNSHHVLLRKAIRARPPLRTIFTREVSAGPACGST